MSNTLELHEDCVNTLYKYASKTPSSIPILLGTIAMQWYRKEAGQWQQRRWMMPLFPSVPETFMMSVMVASYISQNFKSWCHGLGLNSADVMTFLTRRYIAKNRLGWWGKSLKDKEGEPPSWKSRK